eukprot:322976_1
MDIDLLLNILECLIDKHELHPAMEVCEWLNANTSTSDKITPDLHVKILKECIAQKELAFGKYIYSECMQERRCCLSLCLCLEIYYQLKDMAMVKDIWNDISTPTATACNIMCRLYAQNGEYEQVMSLYSNMKEKEIEAEKETLVALINVCSDMVNLERGKSVHLDMKYMENVNVDVDLNAALLNMYSKCGDFANSVKHWNDLKSHNEEALTIEHYNCIINAHAICG